MQTFSPQRLTYFIVNVLLGQAKNPVGGDNTYIFVAAIHQFSSWCGETYITHHANEHAGLFNKERDENSQPCTRTMAAASHGYMLNTCVNKSSLNAKS